jgi:hypothetical protein
MRVRPSTATVSFESVRFSKCLPADGHRSELGAGEFGNMIFSGVLTGTGSSDFRGSSVARLGNAEKCELVPANRGSNHRFQ